MKRILTSFLALMLLIPGSASAGEAEREAVAAAQAWLKLVDKGEYGKSWDKAAPFMRAAVGREGWERALTKVRKPLGEALSRTVQSAIFTRTLPGAPDGEYVVIQFATRFANKESAVETITPSRELDGTWRVSGYYIR